ncbi:DNA translocase FtsK 4TM domain-containing protein, partial [Frankia sp. AiPs1]|uniref:DNA translocase FtsK 4TM domain-containing protein n=1 Tax=Frankia sp. AiPs1 TaxID=573493 RepID=UPI002042F2CE
ARPGGSTRSAPAGRAKAQERQRRPPLTLMVGQAIVRTVYQVWMAAATLLGTMLRRTGRGARDLRIDPAHRRDGLGLAAFGGAILAAVAVWFSAGGPVGSFVAAGLELFVGAGAWALPLFGLGAAWRLVRAPSDPDSRGRVVIGWAALGVGLLGVVHIARGLPDFSDGIGRVRGAGGLVGLIGGLPLAGAVTPFVAVPLLLLIAAFGVLVITATPIRQVPERLAELVERLTAGVRDPGARLDDGYDSDYDPADPALADDLLDADAGGARPARGAPAPRFIGPRGAASCSGAALTGHLSGWV